MDIEARRADLVALVSGKLGPIAQRYGYSEAPLEATIKWRPVVLILGNYSSGKSTLINELLGTTVQATGQAPTDDSFTVITGPDGDVSGPVRVVGEREGHALLSDAQYPFSALKRHGQRFASHFRLKQVNAPFLRNLALIDTPGMLDSVAERDRGYDYQSVVGDLAEIADLVLVLFDPHKAGTVREAHASLRETLPAKTFEDRVLFVLNRIDECDNLPDLLRVYGTLCWNLSQMLGRKDIPPIRLTYSPAATTGGRPLPEYLNYLANQREELIRAVASAPRYRLDHLAAYAELHGERLAHFLEALLSYQKQRRSHGTRQLLVGAAAGLAFGVAATLALFMHGMIGDPQTGAGAALGVALVVLAVWYFLAIPVLSNAFHAGSLKRVDALTPLKSQIRQDSWQSVKGLVQRHLETTNGRYPLKAVRKDLDAVKKILSDAVPAARSAVSALSNRSDLH